MFAAYFIRVAWFGPGRANGPFVVVYQRAHPNSIQATCYAAGLQAHGCCTASRLFLPASCTWPATPMQRPLPRVQIAVNTTQLSNGLNM